MQTRLKDGSSLIVLEHDKAVDAVVASAFDTFVALVTEFVGVRLATVTTFQNAGIMDYSLLLGVKKRMFHKLELKTAHGKGSPDRWYASRSTFLKVWPAVRARLASRR